MSNKKSSKSWIWIAAIIIAGGGVVAYGRGPGNWFSNDASVVIPGATVRRGPLAIRVIERGSLKAADSVSIRNELEGSSTILSLVKEGVIVKEGDLICELDATNQIEKRVQQEIAVRNADAAYVKSTQVHAIQQSQNESDIAQAKQKLAFAEQDLRKYLEGDKKLSLSKAEQSITLQEEDFKRAKNKLEWSTKLKDNGFLTATELEADTLSKNRSEVLLDQAKKERDLLVEFQVKRDTEKLEADLAEATRELERVKLQAKARLVDFESDMRTNEAKLKIEREKLAKLDNQIAKAKIYAPKAGMIVYAKQEEGGRGMGQSQPIQEGTQVRERQELITIPTAGGMMGTVSLHESVLKQVRPGLLCDVRVEALPSQQFHGSILGVAVLPDQNSWFANPNTRLYTTTVEIFDGVEEMRPGMSCAVEIRVDDIADAIYVPVQSVFRHLGKNVAFVDKGEGRFDVAEVKTGRFNDSHVEVLEGLKEGQIVLLAPPAGFQLQAGANAGDDAPPAAGTPPAGLPEGGAVPMPGAPGAPGAADANGTTPPRGPRGNRGENAGGAPGGRNFGGGNGRGPRGAGRGQRPAGSGAEGAEKPAEDAKSDDTKGSDTDSTAKDEKKDTVKPRRSVSSIVEAPAVAELDHVSRVYLMGDTEVLALEDFSFTFKQGEYWAVMGSSGSGKSTLLNILGCLDRPTQGSYKVRGKDTEDLDDDDLSELRSRHLGFVFQNYNLLPQLNVLENILVPIFYQDQPPEGIEERAVELARRVGLETRLEHKPTELSGGQQQRVAIARALINDPAMILADEATGNLDSHTAQEILGLLDELHGEGKTIVLVTHEPEVGRRAQNLLRLKDGRIEEVRQNRKGPV